MAWQSVSTNAIDIKKHKGEPYEGTYKSHREIQTPLGGQSIWEFIDDDGMPFGIYGFTNLNRAMEALEAGAKCKITYTGTQKVDTKYKKQQDVHQVDVQVWTNDTQP
jgi:hypothetical protein